MAIKLTSYEDDLIQVIDKEKDKYVVFDAYFSLVDELFTTDRITEGNFYYQKMKNFGNKNDIKSTKGTLLLLKSYKTFYYDNNMSAGLDYILLGIGQLENSGDSSMFIKHRLASAIGETGYYYEQIGLYDKALDYYLKGLDYAMKNDCLSEKMEIYNYLFFLYSEHFNDDELGLKYLKKSLKVAEQIEDKIFIKILNSNLAMLHIKMGNSEKGFFISIRRLNIVEN